MIYHLLPTRLLPDAIQRTGGNVAVRMFNRHQALFRRVLELMMRPLDPYQKTAIRFQSLDDLPAIHGGYYNYHAEGDQ